MPKLFLVTKDTFDGVNAGTIAWMPDGDERLHFNVSDVPAMRGQINRPIYEPDAFGDALVPLPKDHWRTDTTKRIVAWRKSKGFFTPDAVAGTAPVAATNGDLLIGKIMLVVTESAEMYAAINKQDWANLGEEIADAVIRLQDIIGTLGYDVPTYVPKTQDELRAKGLTGELLFAMIGTSIVPLSRAVEAVRDQDLLNTVTHLKAAVEHYYLIASGFEVDLNDIISRKMDVNAARPEKHGRKTNI